MDPFLVLSEFRPARRQGIMLSSVCMTMGGVVRDRIVHHLQGGQKSFKELLPLVFADLDSNEGVPNNPSLRTEIAALVRTDPATATKPARLGIGKVSDVAAEQLTNLVTSREVLRMPGGKFMLSVA